MQFSIKDVFSKCDQILKFTVDLVTLAWQIFNSFKTDGGKWQS